MRARGWLGAVLATGLFGGCTPEIGSEAYFCGEGGLCPPDLVCEPNQNLCVIPESVEPFACTAGTPPAALVCGSNTSTTDCIGDPGAHVHYAIPGCAAKLQAKLLFPIGLMPLAITVRDGAGEVVGTSVPCGDGSGGRTAVCVDVPAMSGVTYDIDISAAMPVSDCDGTCPYNRFALSIGLVTS
ncbi:MAG: hypothetical protein K8W52_45315 [Deltaproteobacteria bacterium]|nr:hypothetical protein [Deltaproteobacteria bacterium]